ncbi:cysteine-rich repeat secretory protein 55-like [Phragmites australis]|uniref:cysteine-rich repeat secretory protein 55-like n=1 Tax=Phragmites australis TaxID=29695 RepID=UPI002D768B91|nr:cysteine-rich repeat secretory protein 55-like [Phragmites australis]
MAFRRACRCLLLVSLALLPLGMAMDSIGSYCAGTSYAGSNKAVANINSVLADLVATGSSGGFATSTAGKGNNVIYGLAQCRGDVSASDCAACLSDAANQLPSTCSYSSDARIWYDYCFVRYENANFFGQSDTDAGVVLVNVQAEDNAKAFEKAVGKVMGKVTAQASAAGSAGLGRDKEQYTPFVSIYGLAQCTRDLAPLTCAQCLSTAVSRFGDYCGAQQGCQINYSSCRVRYEIYPFYFPLAGSGGGRATTDMTKYTKIVVHP